MNLSPECKTYVSTDTVCFTHVGEKDLTAQVFSDIYPSPITSCGIESCILTNTVYLTHAAQDSVNALFIQTK